MTREEHLEFCRVCTNKKLNRKVGLVCSLTDQIADFEMECSNFKKDDLALQVEYERKMAASSDFESGDPLDYKKNKTKGLVILSLGLFITIASNMMINVSRVGVITYGAIIYGAVLYYKGMQQERIANEYEEKNKKD